MAQDVINNIAASVKLPRMIRTRQKLERPVLTNLETEIRRELSRKDIEEKIRPGMNIAVACGSRGIDRIALIVREIISFVKERGAYPFIVPAMGSHGGATAEGQRGVLESYGITEQYCGCPILSSMETKQIGTAENGQPVLIDKYAAESDGIIATGRVKAHTEFRGTYESGIMKMLAIGLGKREGADICHRNNFSDLHHLIPMFGKAIMEMSPFLFGFAIVENGHDEVCKAAALTAQEVIDQEPKLLAYSKSLMAKIHFDSCDILIVDKCGKDLGGNGMDPNVTGKFGAGAASGGIDTKKLVVLDLTDATEGNAHGIGAADITTRRLFAKIRYEPTYLNGITGHITQLDKIPIVMDSDRAAIAIAVKTCHNIDENNPRIIRIYDTLHLDEIWISEALLPEALNNPRFQLLSKPEDFSFDQDGNLKDLGMTNISGAGSY